MSDFSSKLKYYRKLAGLTQEELAAQIGMRKSTICNYESGYSEPNLANLKIIAETLHVSPDILLGEKVIVGETDPAVRASDIPILSHSTAKPTGETLSFPPSYLKKDDCFAFFLPDETFAAVHLHRGDLVICQKHVDLQDGDLAAVRIDGSGMLLRYYYAEKNQVTLTSPGKNPPLHRKRNEITVLGKVIKSVVNIH